MVVPERSAWTFVQAFAASAVVTGKLVLGDLKIAAAAGAIAVLKALSVEQTVRARCEYSDHGRWLAPGSSSRIVATMSAGRWAVYAVVRQLLRLDLSELASVRVRLVRALDVCVSKRPR